MCCHINIITKYLLNFLNTYIAKFTSVFSNLGNYCVSLFVIQLDSDLHSDGKVLS